MVKLVNRAKMSTATVGTGTITLGTAPVGYQSFASAGIVNGDEIRYVIEDGDNWEIGTGAYAAAGTTLTRTVLESSNAGLAVALSGNAVVFVSATAEDFLDIIPGVISVNQPGPLILITGTARWYSPADITVNNIVARLNTAADSNVTIVIKKNNSAAATITVLANQTIGSTTDAVVLAFGDYLTVDITAIGTINKGEDLNIQFIYKYNQQY